MEKKSFSDELWGIFTEELKNVINFIETTLTYEHPVLSINENYFLLAIFQERDCLAYKIIDALLSSTAFNLIHDAYFRIITKGQLTTIKPNRKIPFDAKFHDLIDEGIKEMKKLNDERLSTIHIVLALINPELEHKSIQKIMKGGGLNYQLLLKKLSSLKDENITPEEVDEIEKDDTINQNSDNKKQTFTILNGGDFSLRGFGGKIGNNQFISTYCHDLNKKAKEGKIDPVIGRDKEIERISKVFNRRRKNNVVVVGEKGCGKTAICESLAWYIVNDKAPCSLKNKTVLKLDIPAMIAGTTYRGMFEERARGVFNELQKTPDAILFIDDFHVHATKRDNESNTDITPFLIDILSDNSVSVIVTCTQKGYHKKFDSDMSLANKFQRVDLTTLSDNEIKDIIMTVKGTYEKYHAISISEEIIDLCISLCKKYITDKEMPDSVIDLIDELGVNKSNKYKESEEIKKLKNDLNELSLSKKESIKKEEFDIVDEISEKEIKLNKQIKDKEKKQKTKVVNITNNMVFETISELTGVPIQNLTDDAKKDLSHLNERLKKVIIGQDEAIDEICKAIKRKKLGLYNNKGTAYFMKGQTGVGKTFLAKKLAEELFGSESALIRFDMSEYSDKTGVNKLIGSNAGYVGYEEGGLLTEAIKNKKHCILLLDEIEKAHDDIFNVFLQVFDNGTLTDNTGQKVDFRNVIIILTSNIGARKANELGTSIGFNLNKDDKTKSESILDKELKKRFSPEFLNRLDGIINFNALTDENLKTIIRLEMDKSVNRFKDIGYDITYDNSVIDFIFDKIKDDKDYGARPIIRQIQNEIEGPLTDYILNDSSHAYLSIKISDDNNLIINS